VCSSSIGNGDKKRRAARCGSCLGGRGCWNTRNSSSHVCCVWRTLHVPASVHEWQKRFREGCTSLQDDSRPGQAHRAITPDVIARIDGLIRENRRITEEEIRVLKLAIFKSSEKWPVRFTNDTGTKEWFLGDV